MMRLFFLGTLLFTFLGCRKDVVWPPASCFCEQACGDLPAEPANGWTYSAGAVQYLSPQFNPNNGNEFIYLRTEDNEGTSLVKNNIETKTSETLLNGYPIVKRVEWGRSGWIVFSTSDNKIWKIRDNGTDLTKLISDQEVKYPHFTHDGNQIIFYKTPTEFGPLGEPLGPRTFIMDLEGNQIDSVMKVQPLCLDSYFLTFETMDIYNNDIYFFRPSCESGFFKFNIEENKTEVLATYTYPIPTELIIPYSIQDIAYNSENKSIYFTTKKHPLLRLDLNNIDFHVVKCGCETEYISKISMSHDYQSIICEKVINRVVSNSEIEQNHEIWLMDVNGCNAKKILGSN